MEKFYYFYRLIIKTLKSFPQEYISSFSNFLSLEKKFLKRHVIIIISDLLDITNNDIKLLKVLSEKNEVLII
jgi:hypothetical protein